MKKRYWHIIIGIICSVVVYRGVITCDFSHFAKLSPAAIGTMALLVLLCISIDISYVYSLLKATALFTGFKDSLLLYWSSYLIGIFSTCYIGHASFVIILKKTARTSFPHALCFSGADLAIRYSLRAVFACLGIALLFGYQYILLISGVIAVLLLPCMLYAEKIVKFLRTVRFISSLVQYVTEIWNAAACLSPRKLVIPIIIACSYLFLESFVFLHILYQFGIEYNLLLVLGIRSLGIIIGFLSFLPTLNIVEDLGVAGLWVLAGMEPSIAVIAVALNRILFSMLPVILGTFCIIHTTGSFNIPLMKKGLENAH